MILVEARIRALETRSRWLSRALAALLLPAAFAVVAAASPALNVPDVLAARRFHLIDENGALVGRWVASEESMRIEALSGDKIVGVVEVVADEGDFPAEPASKPADALNTPPPAAAPAADSGASKSGTAPTDEKGKKKREPFDWIN